MRRNHLLPVNYLSIQVPKHPDRLPPRRQQRRSRKVAEKSPEDELDSGASESEPESHDGVWVEAPLPNSDIRVRDSVTSIGRDDQESGSEVAGE